MTTPLADLWDEHLRHEFATRDTEATLQTMVDDAYVNDVPVVVIAHFRDGRLAHEHIYWDQASVLAQIGLLDTEKLPVIGAEAAEKVLDARLPANRLMERADG